jgi:chromosome segregation protein
VHLRAIKLRGFKSFPEPVEVRLEPGVAVVVGPNGSGKSNISDAILWATGSLAPSELRAERPDDVLFAGSAGCAAADFCEVELVFDNSDGALSELDFSEVSVARRLHRGGEGQYLVNRAAVRRIDLIELLSDVGLGGGMRSVISQGRVEAVLASKPDERRSLIEEAAGLGRFKRRRHRAELKLARVAVQAERARDLEDEVRKRLRPLALQATAAERAEKLRDEILRLRAGIAALDLGVVAERRAEAEERRTAAQLGRRMAEGRLDDLLEERARAEEELADAAGAREGATAALYRLRSAGERVGLRRESVQGLLEAAGGELETARAVSPAVSIELERSAREADAQARAAVREAEEVAAAAGRAYRRLAGAERSAERELAARLDAVLASRTNVEQELAGTAGAREEALTALLRLRGCIERVGIRGESIQSLRGELERELQAARSAMASAGASPEELEAEADEAEAAARSAASERDTLRERARLARERLEVLEHALAEREGIPPAARALAEAGERLALSLLEVEPGYERAVAAALAWRASALVASDPARGLALLERAREQGLGSLAVVVGRRRRTGGAPVPGARPLAEVAAGAEELLDRVWLVERSQLLDATTGVAITEDGFGYDAERGELWFAGETAEAVLLELDARRRLLEQEAAELERRTENAAHQAEAAAERGRAAAAAFAEVAHLKRARRADPALLGRLVGAAERLDEKLLAAARRAAELEQPLEKRASARSIRSAELSERLLALAGEEAEARGGAGEAAARAAVAEREAGLLGASDVGDLSPEAPPEDPATLGEEAASLGGRARAAAERAAAATVRARQAARALAEADPGRRGDPVLLDRLVAIAGRLDAGLELALAGVDRFDAPLRARVDAGAARVTELGAELQRLGAAEVEARRAAAEAGERVAAVDVELARLQAEQEDAQRRLDEAGAEPADGDGRDELAERLDRLERRREQLGQVNPLAKEEYEQEKERLAELTVQREDLEQSLHELERVRDEAAAEVERRFAETFDAVERNFAEVAATLFPGGEGRLRLTEPAEETEGAEPGVEVELRPAGKRITRLSLLSGGEKALGAISFLFALFLARPCPFYLLDEVEAALDDTNIGRFVELLRRYADRAQFIVITHQKRTMEAADVLYGVTMGGDGVSQIVSRRLPREGAAAASA